MSEITTALEEPEKKSAAALLVDMALEAYQLGCTPDGDVYAVPLPGGHVVRPLRGGRSSLRAELAATFRARTGRVAPQQALADALLVLEGEAQNTDPTPVHLRVAEYHGVLYVDLGDAAERVVRISDGRWTVVDSDVPVLFRRTALTGALPVPEPGGRLDDLWTVLNVAIEDRPLVLGWLVATLVAPEIPHPILALFGEQGTGKSTASRTLVSLVDPSPVPLRKPPRDPDGWVTAAAGSWVVGLDNLSGVADWLSDTLCRAVTGDGDVRRQLYTDAGLAVFSFRRCVVLNGIDLAGLRADLTERLVVVNLAQIPDRERRSERDLAGRWLGLYPRLIGALLGEVASVARIIPDLRLDTAPRMADYAAVLAALDHLHGTDGLGRYLDQARNLAADTLAAEPFLVALDLGLGEFEGTAAELLDLVTARQGEDWRPGRDWPKSARAVTTILKRNAPALRRAGWTVVDQGSRNKDNTTRWRIVPPPEKAGNHDSPNSPNSPTVRSGEVASQTRNGYGQSQEDSTPDPADVEPPADLFAQFDAAAARLEWGDAR